METKWIAQNGSRSLILFFCGWGFDERCINHIGSLSHDVAAVYDYRSLAFDRSMVEGYERIDVVAWSFGVWVAGWLMEQGALSAASAYAINGSLNPVDDREGIPSAIYEGTVAGLTEASLRKFMMRICGGARGFAEQKTLMPQRHFEGQRDELVLLGKYFTQWSVTQHSIWTMALISTDDLIFPYQNLKRHWGDKASSISGAHLCFAGLNSWETFLSDPVAALK